MKDDDSMDFLTIDDFEIGKYLGSGTFGNVFLAMHIKSGFVVAIKILEKAKIDTKNYAKQLRRELEIHINLKHPNILAMYGYFYDNKSVYMILEYAPSGEMFTKLQRKRFFTEVTACSYIFQVAKAINYMHKCGVIHRDIKPENLLIGADDCVKLCDFGWAVKNVDQKRYTLCGTVEYLAPEMLAKEKHSEYLDMWCLGILTYEFLTGKPPFSKTDENDYRNKVMNLNYTMPNTLSENAKDFIRKLLVPAPEKRLKIEEVCYHPWIIANISELERMCFDE